MAALLESDAKKIVALSTLSQLGLMYLAISLGGAYVCLFHLVIHAFAKASLFLVVGNFIHFQLSQQDGRVIASGGKSSIFFLLLVTSLVRLRGVIFSSGFYSKDFILFSHYFLINRSLSRVLILSVIGLTFTYCTKVIQLLVTKNGFQLTVGRNSSELFSTGSRLILRIFRVGVGLVCSKNMLFSLGLGTLSGVY